MKKKENKNSETIIGYSAFRLFDECYEYNENACYIADSPESLKEFLERAMFAVEDYRTDAVKISDIIDDYGCSLGEFAMEPEALKRFKKTTDLTYSVEPYDHYFNKGEPDLFVVNLDKKTIVSKVDIETKVSEILEAFKLFDGIYKREQIDAAIELKEKITPYLIDILKKVLSNPNEYIENENLYDHIYALMLLGHFRESRAHNIIVDLFSLSGELPHDLFGDLTTSDLPTLLLRTCGGSLDLIRSLALNKDADDYCRISALHAMAYAVVDGIASRDEVLSFFETLFTGDEADEISDFWSLLANLVLDIYPEEIMSTIKQAYENGLIASGMIGYEDFEKALEDGQEKCLEKLKIDLERHSLDDIHAGMSWWACFNEASDVPFAPAGLKDDSFPAFYDQPKHKSKKKQAKAKKKKRKQAKASKRKNRRK